MNLLSKNQRGAYMVFFVLILPILLGFMGFAVDVSYYYAERTKLQNIADAAALAGAQELPDRAAAERQALACRTANDASNPSTTLSFDAQSRQMSVALRKDFYTTFARVIGVKTLSLQVKATAERTGGASHVVFADGDAEFGGLSIGRIEGKIHSSGAHSGKISGLTKGINLDLATQETTPAAMPALKEKLLPKFTSPSKTSDTLYKSGSIHTRGDLMVADCEITGNVLRADGNITLGGEITLSKNLNDKLVIYAEKDITFYSVNFAPAAKLPIYIYSKSGSIKFSSGSYQFNMSQPTYIFSEAGDITLDAAAAMAERFEIKGILYAPQGLLYLKSKRFTLHGSLIAKEFRIEKHAANDNYNLIYRPVLGSNVRLVE